MPPISRRQLLVGSAALAALLAAPAWSPAWAQADRSAEATRFVDQFGNQLVAIVNASDGLAAKREQVRPLIERDLAVDEIGQFVLGRYWRLASPAQQGRFLQLFHAVLIKKIVDSIGDFRGVGFRLTQTAAREGDYFVGTLVSRPNQQPNNAQWVVSFESGSPKIVDVIAEGTSLRLTQRSDYASFLARNNNNVDALLEALQRQTSA